MNIIWLFFIVSSLLCSSVYSINSPIVKYYYCRSSSRTIRQGTENIEIIIDYIRCWGWIQPGYIVPLQMGALKTKKEACDDGNVWNITWMYNSQHSVRLYYASVHINWGNSLTKTYGLHCMGWWKCLQDNLIAATGTSSYSRHLQLFRSLNPSK